MEGENLTLSGGHCEHPYSKVSISDVSDSCLDTTLQSGNTPVKLFSMVGQSSNVLEQLSAVYDTKHVKDFSITVTPNTNDALIDGALSEKQLFFHKPDSSANICQASTYDNTSNALAPYKGMFSVEQHFVCLICCTCLITDCALVLHLQIHIHKNEGMLPVPSSDITVDQADQVLSGYIDIAECHDDLPITDSDNNATSLHDSLVKIEDTSCLQTNDGIVPCPNNGGQCSKDSGSGMDNISMKNNGIHGRPTSNQEIRKVYPCSNEIICVPSAVAVSSYRSSVDTTNKLTLSVNNSTSMPVQNQEMVIVPVCDELMKNMLHKKSVPVMNNPVLCDNLNTPVSSLNIGNVPTYRLLSKVIKLRPPVNPCVTCNEGEAKVSVAGSNGVDVSNNEHKAIIDDVVNKPKDQTLRKEIQLLPHVNSTTRNKTSNDSEAKVSGVGVDCSKNEHRPIVDDVENKHKDQTYRILSKGIELLPPVNATTRNTTCNESEAKVCAVGESSDGHGTILDNFVDKDIDQTKAPLECFSKQKHMCEICGMILCHRHSYLQHVKHKHYGKEDPPKKSEKLKCHLCPKTFVKSHWLKRHIRLHKGEKPYMCTQCGQRTNSVGDLNRHMRIHSDERPCVCSICNKAFKQSSTLVDHMAIHTGERRHKCENCPKSFNKLADLNVHKASKHTSRGVLKTFRCTQCCKTFSTYDSHRIHLKIHTRDKPYACDTCGWKCYTEKQLSQHRWMHTGIKPYTCTLCGSSYFRKGDMIRHMKTKHSIEITQQCIICKQRIPDQDLVLHMKIHNKRYSCYECGDNFETQIDLTEHLKTHFGDKPHICSICKRRFHIYASLLSHLKSHSIQVIADET